MIRYSILYDDLKNLLEQERPGWLNRALERTNGFETAGRYEEPSSIWSEVKAVYMRIQFSKCAYCERQLESEVYGSIEHDLEHFRPKKRARPWRLNKALKDAGVFVTTSQSDNNDPGYHLLAYHPLNYCTSCKSCNSRLKSDYFPIQGMREPDGRDPQQLSREKPLLINPVGDFDDDPASIIAFNGLSPWACGETQYKRHRGLVTIAFFHLDDRQRKYLFRERASIIVSLFAFLENAKNAANQVTRQIYEDLVKAFTQSSAPHANCARCFCALYLQDRNEAEDTFKRVANYLDSMST